MLRLTVAWVLVNGLLMAPAWLSAAVTDDGAVGTAGWIALEATLAAGGLSLLPRRRWSVGLAWAVAVAVVLITAIGVVDVVFQVSLARPLNLFLDLYLASAVYNLSVGNMGFTITLLAAMALILSTWAASFGLARLLTPAGDGAGRSERRLAGIALVALFALGVAAGASPVVGSLFSAPAARLARAQGALLRATWEERERFGAELTSPHSYAALPGLLSQLQNRDVLITFVESYGMAALDDPEFAAVIRPRLDGSAERLAGAGLHLATGRLTSPTTGGQSWYAHGTVISGLWLSNQLRYELLLASDRETLVDDFRRAGYRTAALMPAITMRWPDGERLRYDEVHTAANIPYAGPPLYWVTMPDQFTWSYLQRTVRPSDDDRPHFVEAALVSSHAPWTPILPMIDWNEVGDGSQFAPFKQEGHPPEELWIDTDQLRRQYAQSMDYSLQAMTGFAERYVDDETLLVVMGDHQAAPWVTGAASADVPVHVIAGDPALLEPFLAWGFLVGAVPDTAQPVHRMDEFRGWFVHAFSNPPEADDARCRAAHGC